MKLEVLKIANGCQCSGSGSSRSEDINFPTKLLKTGTTLFKLEKCKNSEKFKNGKSLKMGKV
jgi:hypothetical protein